MSLLEGVGKGGFRLGIYACARSVSEAFGANHGFGERER